MLLILFDDKLPKWKMPIENTKMTKFEAPGI